MNMKVLSALASVVGSVAMLIGLIRVSYIPGLGILSVLAVGIPFFGLLTLLLWPHRKTSGDKKKLFDGQFYFIGSLVAFIALSTVGIQLLIMFKDSDKAVETAVAQTRNEFPGIAWAFDELDKCNKGQGTYANSSYMVRGNCDLAVTEQAKKRGVEAEFGKALQRREMLIQDNKPVASWPLSML